jgi:hypothetical protein
MSYNTPLSTYNTTPLNTYSTTTSYVEPRTGKEALPEFQLRVVEGRGLWGDLRHGASDPYLVVKLKGLAHIFKSEKQISGVVWNNSNPIWNQDFVLHPTKTNDVISITVFDKDKFGKNTKLGRALITTSQYLNRGLAENWIPLTDRKGALRGELRVSCNYGHVREFIPNFASSIPAVSYVQPSMHYTQPTVARSILPCSQCGMTTQLPASNFASSQIGTPLGSSTFGSSQYSSTPLGTSTYGSNIGSSTFGQQGLGTSQQGLGTSTYGSNIGSSTFGQQGLGSSTFGTPMGTSMGTTNLSGYQGGATPLASSSQIGLANPTASPLTPGNIIGEKIGQFASQLPGTAGFAQQPALGGSYPIQKPI